MKTTCRLRDTFVLAGIAKKAGKFDGIYPGRKERGRLVYAGKLERGFDEQDKILARAWQNLSVRLHSTKSDLMAEVPATLGATFWTSIRRPAAAPLSLRRS